MNTLSPRYLDGVTSQARDVTLLMTGSSLIISMNHITLDDWSYSKIFVKEDWIDAAGAVLGYKDNLDASLVIYNHQQFQKMQERLSTRHRASFMIPTHYRHLFLLALGATAAGFILFPIISNLAGLATYLVPQKVERKLGQLVIAQMETEFKPCDDKAAIASLQKITTRLEQFTGESNMHPDIYLFKSRIPNAFSLPGQKIAVLSAFLNEATSENEIAAVMAHEMGHMAKRDSLEGFIESQGITIIAGMIGASGSYGDMAKFASFVQNMKYSRQKEFRADEYGSLLLIKAGYSPQGLSSFLSRMDKKDDENGWGDSAKYIEFLSTHPDTKERIKRIGSYSRKSDVIFRPSLTQAEFLRLKDACRS